MLVKNNYYIHPNLELVVQGLYEKIIRAGRVSGEFAFIKYAHLFAFRASSLGLFLQCLDPIPEFFQEDLERILYGSVTSNVDPVPEIHHQIRGLKHHVIITARFIQFDPVVRVLQ
jgi:hypothetical protein